MSGFEYKVVPAPTRGLKGKGIKGTQARFANALQSVMNELGSEGWEYQRTDTLPVEERQGLTGKTTSFQNMLVFRRVLVDDTDEAQDVAALIEDQRHEVIVETAIEEPPAPEPKETTEAETAVDPSTDDVSKTESRERVSETLKADPFTFPWDRRARVLEQSEKTDSSAASDDAR